MNNFDIFTFYLTLTVSYMFVASLKYSTVRHAVCYSCSHWKHTKKSKLYVIYVTIELFFSKRFKLKYRQKIANFVILLNIIKIFVLN